MAFLLLISTIFMLASWILEIFCFYKDKPKLFKSSRISLIVTFITFKLLAWTFFPLFKNLYESLILYHSIKISYSFYFALSSFVLSAIILVIRITDYCSNNTMKDKGHEAKECLLECSLCKSSNFVHNNPYLEKRSKGLIGI